MMPWYTTSIIAGINILLIIGLLYVYINNLMTIKSGFTWGLLIFASLFLMQNILVFYYNTTMMPLYVEAVRPYMVVFTALQTLAFSMLNWVTWK